MLSFYRIKMYWKKQRIPACLFDKNRTTSNVRFYINKVDLEDS